MGQIYDTHNEIPNFIMTKTFPEMVNITRSNKNIYIRRLANVYSSDIYMYVYLLCILIFYTIVTDVSLVRVLQLV